MATVDVFIRWFAAPESVGGKCDISKLPITKQSVGLVSEADVGQGSFLSRLRGVIPNLGLAF